MKKIKYYEGKTTTSDLIEKINELEHQILSDEVEVNDYGEMELSKIIWGSSEDLPYSLVSTTELTNLLHNFIINKKLLETAHKFGVITADVEKFKLPEIDIITAVNILNALIDYYNEIIRENSIKRVILKSTNPDEYPDKEIVCRVIPNDMIGEYLATIPEDKKFYAHKSGVVSARIGYPGEKVITTLKVRLEGKEYILSEEENYVLQRNVNGEVFNDVIVRNLESDSTEQYVVKQSKFRQDYVPYALGTKVRQCSCGSSARYVPVSESRLLTQVDENIVIMTSWGQPAICLAGSYIVTYDAESNDYNTLEQSAFNTTYTRDEGTLKRTRK